MTVRSTPSGRISRTGEKADSAESAAEVRALHALDPGEAVAFGAVTRDRMQQLSQRIVAGHYDQPEVVDEVIKRLLNDL